MEFHRSNEPIDDSFFAEVRRRHPDVDIVLLPPARPLRGADPGADEVAAEALTRVSSRARQLWAAIAPDATERPEGRYRFGIDPGCVRPVASLATRREDGYEVLVRLRHELESAGWDVRRPDGTVERLAGVLDTLAVSASYAEALGVLVFTMTGPSASVGADRARELTARNR
jgi:hypothetical protein